jgi:hypothetical protein
MAVVRTLLTTIALAAAALPVLGLDFQKHYAGTINGSIRIEADLMARGTSVSGFYRYTRIGHPIWLSGDRGDSPQVKLAEYGEGQDKDATGSFRGTFAGTGASFTGRWVSPDGSKDFPFDLRESEDAAWTLEMAALEQERPLSDSVKDSPTAQFSRVVVVPDGKKSPKERQFFLKTLLDGQEPDARLKADAEGYFKGYADQNAGEAIGPDKPWLNWDHEEAEQVMYNTPGLLVLLHETYEYEGGAHGSASSDYVNVDMKSLTIMSLNDVFRSDARAAIADLLTRKAREMNGLAKDQSLQDAGYFVDTLDVTDNFYLCRAGVGFVYGQYEVAPYSAGSVEVFLPMADLRPCLSPWFHMPD